MAKTAYDTDLNRNPANYQPLTPLGFLERVRNAFSCDLLELHFLLRIPNSVRPIAATGSK